MKCRTINRCVLIVLFVSIIPTQVYAGSVSSVNVWLGRTNEASSGSQTYGLYTDIWGTVEEFEAINLISPLGNSYPLGLSVEGDQWGSGATGTKSEIESEFTDGFYTFNVNYTDGTTDSRQVEMAGVYPDFPTNIVLSGTTITWDAWINSQFPDGIEVYVKDSNGNFIVGDQLASLSATSYVIADGVLAENENYVIGVLFVSSAQIDGFKTSSTEITASLSSGSKSSDNLTDSGGGAVNYFLIVLLLVSNLRKQLFARSSD